MFLNSIWIRILGEKTYGPRQYLTENLMTLFSNFSYKSRISTKLSSIVPCIIVIVNLQNMVIYCTVINFLLRPRCHGA